MSASVARDVAKHPWDLGSIPRSPHSSILFFSMLSCADSKIRCTISLTRPARHVSSVQIQRTKSEEYHVQSQTRSGQSRKVKRGFLMGQNSAHPPFGPHPLPLVYSFLFFFIVSNLIINLLIIFIINN